MTTPDKTCKLTSKGSYDPEWCEEIGGVAPQCSGCDNNKKIKRRKDGHVINNNNKIPRQQFCKINHAG